MAVWLFLHFLVVWAVSGALALLAGGTSTLADDRCPLFASEHQRFGVNVTRAYGKEITDYAVDPIHAGWYLDYTPRPAPPTPGGIEFVQVLLAAGFDPVKNPVNVARVQTLVAAQPGAIWILGNEPDRAEFQDSQPPERYAVYYHDTYWAIKRQDPTAQVAMGSIVQPTPVRLRYLDRVLAEFRRRYGYALPVDIWTVHNFVLNEALDDWGAGIPPGLEAYAFEGRRYTVYDHGRLDLFQQQLVEFRRWLAARGYRNRPLYLTEYGILMPDFYGYPPEVVEQYMVQSFDFLRTATDPETGYPADDNRLVQAWGWFSLNDLAYDPESGDGSNGNLFDHDSGAILRLGRAFGRYVATLVDAYADPLVVQVRVAEGGIVASRRALTLTVDVALANGGSVAATGQTVTLWAGAVGQGEPIGRVSVPALPAGCRRRVTVHVPWPVTLAPGRHRLVAVVEGGEDRRPENNRAEGFVYALRPGENVEPVYLPALARSPVEGG